MSIIANLTPTLGRQDHTLSSYAGLRIVTRKPASTATCPDVSDDGRRPLFSGQDGRIEPVICGEKQAPFLENGIRAFLPSPLRGGGRG